MIIKATRIATNSGAGAVASHVLRGEKNEEILVLQGSEAEMHAAMRDAEAAGAKYGLRHYKISPKEGMTSEDARQVLADLAAEFGFDPERATLIEHQKPRAGRGGFNRHWHAIVPEVDAITGRVLDAHWMRPRHEKIARMAEARLGHEVTPGRFNAAVQRALEAEGRHDIAARLEPATQVPRPREGYATNIHQMHNRKGNNLPNDRLAVRGAWERSDNGQSFAAALAEQGIRIAEGEKEGVFVAYRDQDFLGAIHRLVGVPKHEVGERLTAAPLEQPAPPAPENPAPQPEPPTPPVGGVPAPVMAAPSQDAEPAAAAAAATATPAAQSETQPAAATAAPTAPAPKGGGGGGGGGSSPAPAAEAPKPGGGGDLFSSEDPTAGIEPPKVGDLAGELRYREAVMKKAAEIAEKKARAAKPAPQQGGSNARTQTGGGGGGGSDKAAAAAAAAIHEALLELIERGRKARTQAEFDRALEAYIEGARIRHEARRGIAEPHRDSVAPERADSSTREHRDARHDARDAEATRRGEPDAVAGSGRDAGEHHGGTGEDRERAARNAAALGRRFEATRVERGFEGVDLSRARAAHEAMKNGPRPDPLEGLAWDEAKTRKDEFRAQLWEQFRDDGKVLADFARMDRDEVRRAEIEAAEPIRARMRERWKGLKPAQMKRAREIIAANVKAAGDEVREQQKQRPKRDFNDYVRGLAEHFNDERAVFVVRFDERTAERKAALFQPVQEALEAIQAERAKAPRPRNPDEEGKAARRQEWAPYEAAQEKLKEAREAFEQIEKPKGWRWLNGAAYAAYEGAQARVADAHAACEAVKPTPMKLDDAEHKARVNAQAGQGQHERWMNARGHSLDQREHDLLAVRDALESGDKQMIRAMRNGGIDAALELQCKRDEEEKRQREAALKAANVVALRQQNQQNAGLPAPRMR
jgi:hypothetical protein